MLMKFVLPKKDVEKIVLGYLKREHDIDPRDFQVEWDDTFQITIQTKALELGAETSWLDIKE